MDLNTSLCLSMQKTLLGQVTPNLRAVILDVIDETIFVLFYFNDPITEEEEELASLTDLECFAGLSSPYAEKNSDYKIIVLPYPQPIPKKGIRVYQRYEKSL